MAAEGDYIRAMFGWDERRQREFHADAWTRRRPGIIRYDGERIGTLYVADEEGCIRVRQFFILPQYQGRGIGSHLLAQVVARADREGKVTRLAFLKGNRVESLYARHGFRRVQEDERFCFMERPPAAARGSPAHGPRWT